MSDAPSVEPAPPREALPRLFLRFLRFGALAWGGPVAQIAMIQSELVEQERWVTKERFRRTLALYQVLPGPEAHELCVFFGMVARGRIGGVLAGLGFMLPGFALMLLLSWLYVTVGLAQPWLAAVFAGFQAAVVALVARAVHRIGMHAIHGGWLLAAAVAAFVASIAGVHFAITLAATGAVAALLAKRRPRLAAAAIAALAIAALVIVSAAPHLRAPDDAEPSPGIAAAPADAGASPARLFVSGLKAGSLTFGGAYTAIPFLQKDAVERWGWLTAPQFLDGLALGGILPAPLIIFATFVGWLGGGLPGALAMTCGIFLPAFAMTLLAHDALERLVRRPGIAAFLDGVMAGVVGLIAAVLVDLMRAGVTSLPALAIFALALAAAYGVKARWSVAAIVLGSGVLGWLLLRG